MEFVVVISISGGVVIACGVGTRSWCAVSVNDAKERIKSGKRGPKEWSREVTKCTDRDAVGGIRVEECKVSCNDLQHAAGPGQGGRVATTWATVHAESMPVVQMPLLFHVQSPTARVGPIPCRDALRMHASCTRAQSNGMHISSGFLRT